MKIRRPVIQLFSILWLLLFAVTPLTAAPNQPTLAAPVDNASDVSLSPTLSVGVSGGLPMTVKFYQRPANDQKFSIIVLPDTQNYSQYYPALYTDQTQWIVNNRISLNIVYVGHVGDIVNTANSITQYDNADVAMSLLEDPDTTGLADGIPYGMLPGNHDLLYASPLRYNDYFGVSRFSGRAYYAGHYGSDNYNNYSLISIGGMDFIIINLQFAPDSSVLNWADGLLKTHSNRRGIVLSHSILNTGITALWTSEGQNIFNALNDNPNLFLMLCGHMHGENRRVDTGTNGNTIHTILADYQSLPPNGGNGFLRIMEFESYNNQINVTTYSPTLNQYGTQFSLTYNMGTLLGININVASGTTTGITWPAPALNSLTEYDWYVTVSDTSGTTTGPVWSFTTGTGVLDGDFTTPADCDVDGSDLARLIAHPDLMTVDVFAANFGTEGCP